MTTPRLIAPEALFKNVGEFLKSLFAKYLRKGRKPELPGDVQRIPFEDQSLYTWRTQGDGKVRPSHAANAGKTFDAGHPPETGNPGDDYSCRCWAEWQVTSEYLPYDPPLEDAYPELLLLPFLLGPRIVAAFRLFLAQPQRDAGWTLGRFKSPRKWANQLEKRNWTPQEITETIRTGARFPAPNKVHPGNEAVRYQDPKTGKFVVRDEVTKEILQVGGEDFKPNKLFE